MQANKVKFRSCFHSTIALQKIGVLKTMCYVITGQALFIVNVLYSLVNLFLLLTQNQWHVQFCSREQELSRLLLYSWISSLSTKEVLVAGSCLSGQAGCSFSLDRFHVTLGMGSGSMLTTYIRGRGCVCVRVCVHTCMCVCMCRVRKCFISSACAGASCSM